MSDLTWVAPLTTWIEGQQKIRKTRINNTVRLIESKDAYNAQWEQRGILASGKALKWASFGMFSFPLIWTVPDPEAVRQYFEVSLAAVPEWWVKTWVMMTGSIWGISALKESGPALIKGVRQALGKEKK